MASTPLAKQSDLCATFELLVHDLKINLYVNEPLPEITEPLSLDVEHDESGGFVGIGCYLGSTNSHYWFTDTNALDSGAFRSISIVAHNGVSDLDMMRQWGFDVSDEQLVYDTMLIGHILDSSLKSFGLKDMASRDLGIVYPSYDDIVGRRTAKQSVERLTLDKQPPRLVQLYNAMDCYTTAKLQERQMKGVYGNDYQ